MQSQPAPSSLLHTGIEETQAAYMRVIPMATEEELVCEGMRHPFQSKEGGIFFFQIFGGLNYVWYMLLYCFTIPSFD